MTITKSQVVGKSLNDLPSSLVSSFHNSSTNHKVWTEISTKAIDFLSRCTLRYANSYGATYKINPTSDLTITHSGGRSYTLDSYTKLLAMIIVDYNEPTGATMPTQPQLGTRWERLQYFTADSPKGEIITINSTSSSKVGWYGPLGYVTRPIAEFKELFKPRPDLDNSVVKPTQKRGLAFYKESGKSWTAGEYQAILNYCGDSESSVRDYFPQDSNYKYIYDDGSRDRFMHFWSGQVPDYSPEDYTILLYESVFETPATKPISTKTTKPKTKPVAQPEPIIPTPIKEKPMAQKLKDSASATVDQNKQALVIASKMEAGRIINKQVLKQLKPHLPFFLQGYASSPFAPFLAANLVAMTANYVDDSRVKKISELMLLGAADSGVSSLNISKIIDDVLSNIKLPAGVLDDSDDE